MFNNGVSHQTAKDDLNGVRKCLHWLAYTPAVRCDVAAAVHTPLTGRFNQAHYCRSLLKVQISLLLSIIT
jgi:hypothetical protein